MVKTGKAVFKLFYRILKKNIKFLKEIPSKTSLELRSFKNDDFKTFSKIIKLFWVPGKPVLK